MRLFFVSFLAFSLLYHSSFADKQHEREKNPSAVVSGTVYCDTCFHREFTKTSHFISGASLAVECIHGGEKPSFYKEVKTNKQGEFKVQLPFPIGKHVRKIQKCSVRLLSSSEPHCSVASRATSSSLRLTSRRQGTHIFSVGFFTFKPSKQPYLCNEKPSPGASPTWEKTYLPYREIHPLPPLLQKPPSLHLPLFPPVPYLPTIPKLPPIPNLGALPTKPTETLDQKTEHPPFFPPSSPRPRTPRVPLPPTNTPLQPAPPSINAPPNPTIPFPFPPFPFPPGSSSFPGVPPFPPRFSGFPISPPVLPGPSGFPGSLGSVGAPPVPSKKASP